MAWAGPRLAKKANIMADYISTILEKKVYKDEVDVERCRRLSHEADDR